MFFLELTMAYSVIYVPVWNFPLHKCVYLQRSKNHICKIVNVICIFHFHLHFKDAIC